MENASSNFSRNSANFALLLKQIFLLSSPGQPIVRRTWLLLLLLGTGVSQPNRTTRVSTFLFAEIALVSDSWFSWKMTKEYCYEHCRRQTFYGNFAECHLLRAYGKHGNGNGTITRLIKIEDG